VEVEIVAERSQTVSHVTVAVEQLIAARRVDGHVTSGHAHAATVADTCAVDLYQAGDVLHQEAVQLARATTACALTTIKALGDSRLRLRVRRHLVTRGE